MAQDAIAIKGVDLIHVGNRILIDRAQTAGPGQVNIPTEKIYELGNFKSIGQIRDTPDLSFTLESFDVSPESEALVTGSQTDADVDGLAAGTMFDLAAARPIDVASQFKAGRQAGAAAYDVIGSVALPPLSWSPSATASASAPARTPPCVATRSSTTRLAASSRSSRARAQLGRPSFRAVGSRCCQGISGWDVPLYSLDELRLRPPKA